LAFLFPEHDFIGVDLNETSIRMLEERAANAKLTNVRSKLSLIESRKKTLRFRLFGARLVSIWYVFNIAKLYISIRFVVNYTRRW